MRDFLNPNDADVLAMAPLSFNGKGDRNENTRWVHQDDTDRRLLIMLPLYLSVLLLAKADMGLLALVHPITAQIPASVQFREVLAILLVAVFCFVVSLH